MQSPTPVPQTQEEFSVAPAQERVKTLPDFTARIANRRQTRADEEDRLHPYKGNVRLPQDKF